MRPEYDFSGGERGRFFRPNAKLNLPVQDVALDWAGPDADLGAYITEESRRTITAYKNQPRLVLEHANLEQDTARGGYATANCSSWSRTGPMRSAARPREDASRFA